MLKHAVAQLKSTGIYFNTLIEPSAAFNYRKPHIHHKCFFCAQALFNPTFTFNIWRVNVTYELITFWSFIVTLYSISHKQAHTFSNEKQLQLIFFKYI